jgi:hypothetical protein
MPLSSVSVVIWSLASIGAWTSRACANGCSLPTCRCAIACMRANGSASAVAARRAGGPAPDSDVPATDSDVPPVQHTTRSVQRYDARRATDGAACDMACDMASYARYAACSHWQVTDFEEYFQAHSDVFGGVTHLGRTWVCAMPHNLTTVRARTLMFTRAETRWSPPHRRAHTSHSCSHSLKCAHASAHARTHARSRSQEHTSARTHPCARARTRSQVCLLLHLFGTPHSQDFADAPGTPGSSVPRSVRLTHAAPDPKYCKD